MTYGINTSNMITVDSTHVRVMICCVETRKAIGNAVLTIIDGVVTGYPTQYGTLSDAAIAAVLTHRPPEKSTFVAPEIRMQHWNENSSAAKKSRDMQRRMDADDSDL